MICSVLDLTKTPVGWKCTGIVVHVAIIHSGRFSICEVDNITHSLLPWVVCKRTRQFCMFQQNRTDFLESWRGPMLYWVFLYQWGTQSYKPEPCSTNNFLSLSYTPYKLKPEPQTSLLFHCYQRPARFGIFFNQCVIIKLHFLFNFCSPPTVAEYTVFPVGSTVHTPWLNMWDTDITILLHAYYSVRNIVITLHPLTSLRAV